MRFVPRLSPTGLAPLLLVLTLLLLILRVSSVLNNQYMTFFTPNTSRRYIYLEGKFSYSVQLVLQKGNNSLFPNSTLSQTSTEFIIRAPQYSYYGVMAIIQSLQLRKGSPQGTEYCRDYIQFKPEKSNSTVEQSTKICGSLDRGVEGYNPKELIGARTYFNPKGNMIMNVHVDPVRENDVDWNLIGAEIVFTAYTECPGTEVGLKTLQLCSTEEYISCIPSTLFCDSKIDCGFEDGFGMDEERCYFPYLYGAIAVIFISLVLLSIYAFVCWIQIKAKRFSATPV